MIVVVGMECLLTATFVNTLCEMGRKPAAVILSDATRGSFDRVPHRLPIVFQDGRVDETSHRFDIPLYRVHDWNTVPDQFLMQFHTILVVCYPTLLPAQRFTELGIRAWNVHPAPLPALRGPDPLFYTARGDAPATITIHVLDATYDTGAIIATSRVVIPSGCTELPSIRIHAAHAAQLYVDIAQMGRVGVPQQPAADGLWAAFPRPESYTLQSHWPMERTMRFMALTNARSHAYLVPETRQWVRSIDPAGPVRVQCADGVLRACL
jgi:hypothetical protein